MKIEQLLTRQFVAVLGSILLAAFFIASAQAQDDVELTPEETELREKLASPQQTLLTFLDAIEAEDLDAARTCLDLDQLASEVAITKGNVYVDRLNQVLNRIWDQALWRVSRDSDVDSPYSLAEAMPVDASKSQREDAKLILLTRNEKGLWRFSASTLAQIDEVLWQKWNDPSQTAYSIPVWLEQSLPSVLLEKWIWLKNYQWFCLVLLVLLGFVIGLLVRRILDGLTLAYCQLRKISVDSKPRTILWKPISLLAHATTWYYGAKLFDLPIGLQNVLFISFRLFAVIALVWTIFRFTDLVQSYFSRRAAATASRFDDTLHPVISGVVKVVA